MTQGYKEYILMHRNIEVVQLTLDQITGTIVKVGTVFNDAHIPVGIGIRRGIVDRATLNEWWIGRSIPVSRAGLKHLLEQLQISAPQKLLEKCLGLSLSDAYWIKPAESVLQWSDVNFYENQFSEDVGNILFGGGIAGEISLMSPDNTSDGWLRKKWKIQDGKRCLVKGGSGAIQQEPYNEVIASRIMERLEIPHVEYKLQMIDGWPYSVCEDFITENTEYIPAWYIMHAKPRPNHMSVYQHYLEQCDELGVKNVECAISQQIVIDYLLLNMDRHQGNFGVVRQADTLKYIGTAPIFDSGSSLWFETPTSLIRANTKVPCKPFKIIHEEQIRLVKDFSWLDEKKLEGLGDIVREVFMGSDFVDEARSEKIAKGLEERVAMLKEHIQKREYGIDNTLHDVKKNVAYSGIER